MQNFKIGDKVVYTGEEKPILIDLLRTRKGRVTGFYTKDILRIKFEDGTNGVIYAKNLELQEG